MTLRHTLPVALLALGAVAAQDSQPSVPAVLRQWCERADQAFNQGDADGFFRLFTPLHQSSQRTLTERNRALLQLGTQRPTRTTRVARVRPWSRGLVADVQVALQSSRGRAATLDEILVLELDAAGAARAILDVEAFGFLRGDVHEHGFSCPPCNYAIDVPGDDWLIRPAPLYEGHCHEALAIYSLRTPVVAEVSLHVATHALPAVAALRATLPVLLGGADGVPQDQLASLVERTSAAVTAWSPAAAPTAPGARVRVDLSAVAHRGSLPPILELHLLVQGPLRYLVALHGSAAALDAERADLDRIVGSLRFVADGPSVEDLLRTIASAHHGNGRIDGQRYINPTYKVALTGPEGFAGRIDIGAASFLASWHRPATGCFLQLVGLRTEGRNWNTATAREYMARILATRRQALGGDDRLVATGEARSEQRGNLPVLTTEYTWRSAERQGRGFLGMAWHGDLLVYVEGRAGDDVERTLASLQASFASLRMP